MRKRILLVTLFFLMASFIINPNFLFSLNEDNKQARQDTILCVKYYFDIGDTLIYHVESYDSVIIDYGEPLLKQRYEEIQIVCDSIKDNIFYLTYSLNNYLAFESSGDIKRVQRTSSPWLGRKILIAIDSLGNRKKLDYDDNKTAAVCPGGAFQPPLLVKLADSVSCYKLNSFWNVESLDELVENGFPVPLVREASLLRITGTIDTLDRHCVRINTIKTAQGSYSVLSNQDSIRVSNIIAGAEIIDLDTNSYKIAHMTTTVEQKLTITIGNEELKKGLHYIYTHYTLVEEKKNIRKKR